MSDISKIKLPSGEQYGIKDTIARNAIASHTHPIDTELDDSSTNPVQNSVIANALNNKADANHTHNLESLGIVYGKCFNMENILAKKVSLPDYVLCNNSIVSIKFNYNVKQNSTLNINNTGDKPIYYDNKSIINNIIKAGDTATFIYDGTNYNLINLDKNSYTQYFEANNEIIANSGQCILCNGGENYSYSLIKNNIIYIKFKYFVYANAILNISLSGYIPIYYKGSPIKDGIIRPNDIGVFIYDGTNYNLISVYTSSSTCINSYYFTCSRYEGTKYAITNSYAAELAKFNKGDIVAVHFNDNINDDNSTLQIGSNNNGYLPICNAAGSPIPGGIIKANDTLVFIYDETKYRCIYSFNYSASLNLYFDNGECQESATCSTATEQIFKETTSFKYSDIYHFAGAITYITFENAVPANSTLNNKPIYYKGYPIIDDIINAGDTAMFMSDGTNLHLISLTNENKYSSSNISNILFNIDKNKADANHTHTNESMGFGFGICTTTTSTTDKTVSMPNYKLIYGGIVSIYFDYDVPINATLNINDTGAKPIYYNYNIYYDRNIIKGGDIATFVYDGHTYILISLNKNFDTDSNEIMGFGHFTCDTAASVIDKSTTTSISGYKLIDSGIVCVKFIYSVPANATLNISNTGSKSIYYKGSAIIDGIIKAGDIATFIYDGGTYNLISLDRDFNPITVDTALSTTSTNPVQNSIITNALNNKADANHTHNLESLGIAYAECYTDTSIIDKTASTTNNYTLTTGSIINIKFTNDIIANATLNINDTGAKPIYYKGSAITDGIVRAEYIATFIYDGTNYNLISLDRDFDESRILKGHGNIEIGFGNEFPIYTSEKCFEINNIKYKLIIATFDFYVYRASTINCIPIYNNGSPIKNDIIYPGDTATFIYDSTNNRYELINIDKNIDNDRIIIPYAKSRYFKCDTPAATINKTASSINGYSSNTYNINENYIICIKFTNDVPANATLNINSKGAKPIYSNNAPITDGIIKAGDITTFIYDGTNYNYMCKAPKLEMNCTYSGFNNIDGIFYDGVCNTDTNDTNKIVEKPYYHLAKHKLDIITIKFTNAVPANSTLNNIPIYYNSAPIIDNIINAEDTVKFICDGSKYHLLCSYIDTSFKDINNALNNKVDSTHTHTNESMGQGYTLSNLTQNDNNCIYAYSNNCIPTIDDEFIIKFNNDVPENATLNINDTGNYPIYCSSSLNSNREYDYILVNGFMMPCITNINGMIKSGDTVLIKYMHCENDTNFYYIITSNSHNNENINLYYAEINNISTDISTTIENFILERYIYITIKFNNDVPENATLNINDTGAVSIYYNNAPITDGIINSGDIVIFYYTNSRYNLVATDNYNNENINQKYAECLNENYFYHASLNDYVLSTGGVVSIKFTNDIIANATLNINDTGAKPIYYKGSAITNGIIKAGDTTTFIYDGTNYNLISLDRDFNDPITIDTELDDVSTNPVQNSVITNALNNKADANHTHTDATASSGGLMSATDKANIDNFAANFKNKLSIANGIATLDSNGKVPSIQLPSYVDDIIEGYLYNNTLYEEDTYTTEIIGETGKIYVDLSTNKTYRWSGSNYIEISESLALGETSSTAYRGDYGKIAYEHAQSTNNPHNVVPSVYGYCYTERIANTKIVTINNFKLIPGMIIFIRFSYGVPYQAYLNISNTGAKPIYYKGKINDLCVTENGSNDIIQAGDIVTFIYDAANNRYNLISTNIIGNQRMGSGDGYCDTAAVVNEKFVQIREYVPFEGGIVSIYFVNAVNANSKLKINNYSSLFILHRSSNIGNGIIKAGDRATFMYTPGAYHLISLDRDFNDPITIDSSLSTTSNNPVRNSVITSALNNYIPTIIGTQIESTNNWTGNAQFETLEDGQRILYYLPYDNSSGSDVVLNLTLADGTTQTGNIDCYLSGSARLNSQYEAGSFIPLIYKENITFNGSSTTYTGWWAYTDKDIDSKVQNTLNNTTKAYVTGTTNNTTNIGTQIFDDNVYLGTTAGELNTKSLKLNEKVTLNYNTNNNCIDFIFS